MSVAVHPPHPQSFTAAKEDLAILDFITRAPLTPALKRRDAPLDPLLLAATAASGPHVTRHHFHHGFQPGSDGLWAWSGEGPIEENIKDTRIPRKPAYVSQQAPRKQRLASTLDEENDPTPLSQCTKNLPAKRHRSGSHSRNAASTSSPSSTKPTASISPALEVRCMARTRIPTPHGEAFLHIYHNNQDSKEHLALVVDPAQLSFEPPLIAPIRSKSLDAVWHENETVNERLIRGAYTGRLTSTSQTASSATAAAGLSSSQPPLRKSIPLPLVRIHSECFTGETIGSQRCDCGEQLDEALRQIFEPSTVDTPDGSVVIPGRGAVVYLRQEGRGIGLLSKIRAYNLQDMGHDTVNANLLLGHKADERGYDIACAILRDLGLNGDGDGIDGGEEKGIRLLTNNPDKVRSLVDAGVKIADRVAMVPRSWTFGHQHDDMQVEMPEVRARGATMIGAGATHGPELDRYIRTKVLKMGHMLSLPISTSRS